MSVGEALLGGAVAAAQPMEDRLFVRPSEEAETMYRERIHIPDTAQEPPTQGEVIAVGPGRYTAQGIIIDPGVRVGDIAIYSRYSGTPFTVNGEAVLIIKASELLARVPKKERPA